MDNTFTAFFIAYVNIFAVLDNLPTDFTSVNKTYNFEWTVSTRVNWTIYICTRDLD